MNQVKLFATVLLATGLTQAAPFSQIVAFGDSITDTGNAYIFTGGALPASPPYFDGRFSNGPLWIDYLGAALGLPVNPAISPINGTNYAAGGAKTGLDGIVPGTGVSSQVALYLLTHPGPLDPDALFVLTGGANDLIEATATFDIAAAEAAAQNLVDRANDLVGNGAKNLLIANVGNVGFTPLVSGLGGLGPATILTNAFNAKLASGLAPLLAAYPGVKVVDQAGVLEAIVADALLNGGLIFGIANVGTPCIGGDCSSSLWFDDEHPTTLAHDLYAKAALRLVVPEPSTTALTACACIAAFFLRRRANRAH